MLDLSSFGHYHFYDGHSAIGYLGMHGNMYYIIQNGAGYKMRINSIHSDLAEDHTYTALSEVIASIEAMEEADHV